MRGYGDMMDGDSHSPVRDGGPHLGQVLRIQLEFLIRPMDILLFSISNPMHSVHGYSSLALPVWRVFVVFVTEKKNHASLPQSHKSTKP